jgi:hypothetical protein
MCQYDRKANADTVWSVIYDLKRRQIRRAEGNPSRKAFREDTRMHFSDEFSRDGGDRKSEGARAWGSTYIFVRHGPCSQ